MLPGLAYQVIFWIFAVIAVFSALMVVTRSNPVHSAIWLVLTLFVSSGLYVLLYAHFIAAVQIMVYAGAIMVFFIFVIMLLNLHEYELRIGRFTVTKAVTLLTLASIGIAFLFFINQMPSGNALDAKGYSLDRRLGSHYPDKPQPTPTDEYGTAESIGRKLFTAYMLPFEVASIFLLAAMIGAVVIGRRHEPDDPDAFTALPAGLQAPADVMMEDSDRRKEGQG